MDDRKNGSQAVLLHQSRAQNFDRPVILMQVVKPWKSLAAGKVAAGSIQIAPLCVPGKGKVLSHPVHGRLRFAKLSDDAQSTMQTLLWHTSIKRLLLLSYWTEA